MEQFAAVLLPLVLEVLDEKEEVHRYGFDQWMPHYPF